MQGKKNKSLIGDTYFQNPQGIIAASLIIYLKFSNENFTP